MWPAGLRRSLWLKTGLGRRTTAAKRRHMTRYFARVYLRIPRRVKQLLDKPTPHRSCLTLITDVAAGSLQCLFRRLLSPTRAPHAPPIFHGLQAALAVYVQASRTV